MQNSARGFTLIEMMITVAVLSIILAMAVPSFREAIENARLSTQVNEFVTGLNTARSEAIRTGEQIWLVAKEGDFNKGWCVRTTNDDCGSDAPAPPDLLVHAALDARLKLTDADAPEPDKPHIAFNRLGALATLADARTIEIAPKNCASGQSKRLIGINAIGRVSVSRGSCS